ncbi:MAG: adenosylmethionine--8-amino-7-oxononanoate transaminase [Polyangiaceae bacterium]|nr:adenosylmethionine--8-amino-7-oxononanoate transaminase [Polyangiaceae bacterium]
MDRSEIVRLDKRYVWHPYTPMDRYRAETEPLVIERAAGSRLFDVDGKSYIDGNSSWWVALLGHNHPRLVKVLQEQSQKLCHTSLAGVTHEHAAYLAQELVKVSPEGLEHVFYSDDGSTAVEVGLKLALQYWHQNGRPQRTEFVALDGAFHGETLGSTGLGGVDVFRKPFSPVVLRCHHVPSPSEGLDAAVESLRCTLSENADRLAAFVLEPMVQGASGMRMYDAEYLRVARILCDEHDVFLIADEVFTGYGRTGQMWAVDHAGIAPDIMCMAKGFSGGILPMAATTINSRIFDGFLGDADRAFFYGHTYCGHPLGAAIALEVLRIYQDENIVAAVAPKAAKIEAVFERLAQHEGVSRVRCLGMIGALELDGDGGYLDRAGWHVYDAALRRGAYLRPMGNVVYTTPPLNIPDEEFDSLLEILEESVTEVLAKR